MLAGDTSWYPKKLGGRTNHPEKLGFRTNPVDNWR
jgi:hypothetical protein